MEILFKNDIMWILSGNDVLNFKQSFEETDIFEFVKAYSKNSVQRDFSRAKST